MIPNIVLIGVGRFGKNHLRNLLKLQKLKKINLVGIVDANDILLRSMAKKYSINTSTKISNFLKEADAFDIVSPASTHYRTAEFCLEHSKHVFVEKPLSLNSLEAKKLVQLSKKNNCIIQVGHIFRYNKAVDYIKKNIKLKDNFPYYIKGKFLQTTKTKVDVGSVFNYLHHFDILDNILGTNPNTICANANLYSKNPKHDINSTVFLHYPRGLNVTLDLGWIASGKYRTLELYSKKQITYCDLEKQIIELHRNGKISKRIKFAFKEPLALELSEFVNCMKTGKQPKANGNVGYRVVKIAELTTKSINQKRIIKFPKKKEQFNNNHNN